MDFVDVKPLDKDRTVSCDLFDLKLENWGAKLRH
jgi:hypothetical protein